MKFPNFERKHAYALVAVVLAAGLLYWGFFTDHGPDKQVLVVHRAPYAEQISVSGTVRAAQNVDLGFSQSGRVSGVYAKVGDEVREGALLAQTENGDLRAALATAEADLASLQAGTRPEKIAVTEAQIESDETALAQADVAVLNAIQNAYTRSDDAVRNQVDQFFVNPRTISPTLTFTTSNNELEMKLRTERAVVEGMLNDWKSSIKNLAPSDTMDAHAGEAQTNLDVVSALLSDANAALNVIAPNTTLTAAQVNTFITNIAAARATINAAQSSLTTAVTAQKAAAAALAKDKKNLVLEQAGSTQEDIRAQKARVDAARANLNKTLVIAPFTGTITKMDAKVGEIVSPTSAEISMISSGLFEIEAFVPEVEITGLAVGNAASTTLDAYGPSEFFAAKVIAIDLAETIRGGISTYKVTLQFLKDDERIKPGMTANTMITKRVSQDALVVPQGAIFLKDGRQMVQVLRGDRLEDVQVRTEGGSQIGNVEILSGLSEGDTVVLNPSH